MHDEHPHIVSRNARWGLFFFFIYLTFYGLFVWLSAFRPTLMAREFLAGANLAICYGFALIIAALVLALIYMLVTRSESQPPGEPRP
jgi:uncharacterized membrane protein (DUF485 family)